MYYFFISLLLIYSYACIFSLDPPEYIGILTSSSTDVGATYFIDEDSYMKLHCLAQDAYPTDITYMWTKEGGSFSTEASMLQIDGIQKEDGRPYTCTATNLMTPNGKPQQTGTGTRTVAVVVRCRSNYF